MKKRTLLTEIQKLFGENAEHLYKEITYTDYEFIIKYDIVTHEKIYEKHCKIPAKLALRYMQAVQVHEEVFSLNAIEEYILENYF